MIKADLIDPEDEVLAEWCERCADAARDLIQQFDLTGTVEFDQALYKEQKRRIFLSRCGPFRGKCAYCEQIIGSDQHGDIEHYRPKAKVTDENDRVILISAGQNEVPHPGYYWLAYDWRNLLPACVLCNQPNLDESGSRLGKRNRFPVVGQHATKPGDEVAEQPLLLNPVFDDPSEHLRFDPETGVLVALSERGRLTIRVLGLNERGLPHQRRRVYEDATNTFALMVLDASVGKDVTERAQACARILHGFEEFSLAGRAAIDNAKANLEALNFEEIPTE